MTFFYGKEEKKKGKERRGEIKQRLGMLEKDGERNSPRGTN